MKQIVVISGKGGTGKTVITGSFASLADNKVLADCDVDAADLHLLLKPNIKEEHEFKSGKTAVIDQNRCIQCGKCQEVCRFDAIITDSSPLTNHQIIIDPISCEGCGVCFHICPQNAINLTDNISGEWFLSDTKYGPMVHAKLGIAEENSGKLVSLVRNKAREVAKQYNLNYIIIDGSPGIGCPVIASLSGSDLAIIVTEPTLSGIHDLERILQLGEHFGIKTGCIINKYDLNLDNTENIEKFLRSQTVDIFGRISFSEKVNESITEGVPFVEYSKDGVSEQIIDIWRKIEEFLK